MNGVGVGRRGRRKRKRKKRKKKNRVRAGLENFYPVSFDQSERGAMKNPRVTQVCQLS